MKPTLYSRPEELLRAPSDAARGTVPQPVAEIVTFHLKPGTTSADFLAAAAKTEAFLRASGHVISRTLSRDDTGLWTDYIVWTDMKTAQTMAAQAMQHADFAPLMSMIAPEDVQLRHAPILFQMD
jgi:hypothetical protein